MSSLPSKASFDGAGVTEAGFKAAFDSMIDYLISLIGSTGSYGMQQAQGRLTLTTALPVTTADVAGATTVYYTPFRGNTVRLYDGTDWVLSVFTELSQATTDATKSPAAVAVSSVYDVFVWNDAGTIRATRGPAWTSDTARGTGAGTTELEVFEGRYVNKIAITNGPAARRGLYVGTIRSDASSQINDTLAKRHVWNNFNRVERPLRVIEPADSWNYTVATLRQANANAANQLDFVIGLGEESVQAVVTAMARNTVQNISMVVGIGLDSTSAAASGFLHAYSASYSLGINVPLRAEWRGFPGIGRHFLAWLEYSNATGVTTWAGDEASPTLAQCGIAGSMFA